MKKKLIKNIPNIITITRILSVIIGFILICKNYFMFGIILYIYGAISDMLDGYFARRLNAYSKLGGYLDAISDKMYFFSVMVLSIIYSNFLILIPAVLEIVIATICIMIFIRRKKTYTEIVGKFKMTTEFIMIIIFLISVRYNFMLYIGLILLLLTIYFQIQTIFSYINQLNNKSKEIKLKFNNNKLSYKISYLIKEYINYLCHPVRIIK